MQQPVPSSPGPRRWQSGNPLLRPCPDLRFRHSLPESPWRSLHIRHSLVGGTRRATGVEWLFWREDVWRRMQAASVHSEEPVAQPHAHAGWWCVCRMISGHAHCRLRACRWCPIGTGNPQCPCPTTCERCFENYPNGRCPCFSGALADQAELQPGQRGGGTGLQAARRSWFLAASARGLWQLLTMHHHHFLLSVLPAQGISSTSRSSRAWTSGARVRGVSRCLALWRGEPGYGALPRCR